MRSLRYSSLLALAITLCFVLAAGHKERDRQELLLKELDEAKTGLERMSEPYPEMISQRMKGSGVSFQIQRHRWQEPLPWIPREIPGDSMRVYEQFIHAENELQNLRSMLSGLPVVEVKKRFSQIALFDSDRTTYEVGSKIEGKFVIFSYMSDLDPEPHVRIPTYALTVNGKRIPGTPQFPYESEERVRFAQVSILNPVTNATIDYSKRFD